MTAITSNTKQLLRELAGLQALATRLETLDSIERAEDEARRRAELAQAEAEATAAVASERVVNTRADADAKIRAIEQDIAAVQTRRQAAENALQAVEAQKAATEAELSAAQDKLDATRKELARLAARLGG